MGMGMMFFLEYNHLGCVAFNYEWNVGVRKGFHMPNVIRTDIGVSFHIGPFWFRKWR